jgi:putative acetyltransferase
VSWTIRDVQDRDRDAILALVRTAFTDETRDGSEEVQVVLQTWERAAAADGLDLVALDGELITGHVLGGVGDLGGRPIVAVAPLAVEPGHQGSGVGTALMQELLRRAEQAGWPVVLVLGDPSYYGRFGFEPSGPLAITYPPVGPGDPHFMARRFAGYDDSLRGAFSYCWER